MYVFGVLLVLFGCAYFLLFTNVGNSLLKPYVKYYMSEYTGKNIELSSFTLRVNYVDMDMKIDNKSRVVLSGDFDLFDRDFKLIYIVDAYDIETPDMIIKGKMDLRGRIKGGMDDFNISGSGEAFNSKVEYTSKIKKMKPENLKLQMNGAKIDQMLALANKPQYASGLIDIYADIDDLRPESLSGNSKVKIHYGRVNTELMKKDFNISLPVDFTYRGEIVSNFKGDKVVSKADLVSNIANLTLSNTLYNAAQKRFYSDYVVDIPDLNSLQTLTNIKMKGDIQIDGSIEQKKDILALNAHCDTLGGSLDIVLYDKKGSIEAKNIDMRYLQDMFEKKKYASGKLDISAEFDSIEKDDLQGKISLDIIKGKVDSKLIEDDLNITLPENLLYQCSVVSEFEDNEATSKIDLLTSMADISIQKSIYNLKNGNLQSDYLFNSHDISSFSGIAGMKLAGDIKISGNIKKSGEVLIYDAHTSSFGGEAKLAVDGKKASVIANGVKIAKLLYMAGVKKYAFGLVDIDGDINKVGTQDTNGNFSLKLKEGRVDVELIQKDFKTKGKLPKDFAYSADIQGNIDKGKVVSKVLIDSDIAQIRTQKSLYDLNSGAFESDYTAKIDDLGKFYFLTGAKMKGDTLIEGIVKGEKDHLFSEGFSDIVDSNTTFKYQDGMLNLRSYNVSSLKVSDMLGYPRVFDSLGEAFVDYDLEKKRGNFNLSARQGRLMGSELTDLVLALSKFDMTKEMYENTNLNGEIKNDKVHFKLDMNSPNTKLLIKDGEIDLLDDDINANFDLKIEHRDFKGRIKGKTNKPKVRLDSSAYLKEKLDKKIEKKVSEKYKKPAKQILDLFLH